MENKIGEIITLPDGRKAEVEESTFGCIGCCIFRPGSYDCIYWVRRGELGKCCLRTDHKNIIYKEIKEG